MCKLDRVCTEYVFLAYPMSPCQRRNTDSVYEELAPRTHWGAAHTAFPRCSRLIGRTSVRHTDQDRETFLLYVDRETGTRGIVLCSSPFRHAFRGVEPPGTTGVFLHPIL